MTVLIEAAGVRVREVGIFLGSLSPFSYFVEKSQVLEVVEMKHFVVRGMLYKGFGKNLTTIP